MTDKVRVITEEQYKEYMELKNQTSKKARRWKPIDGDCVWVVYSDGDLDATTYLRRVDERKLKMGFCFKTREEAQKELDRRLAEQELLDMVDAKMSDGNRIWLIEYDQRGPVFYPNDTFFRFTTSFLFSSKESCQKAIDTLGDEKLKLIFRID